MTTSQTHQQSDQLTVKSANDKPDRRCGIDPDAHKSSTVHPTVKDLLPLTIGRLYMASGKEATPALVCIHTARRTKSWSRPTATASSAERNSLSDVELNVSLRPLDKGTIPQFGGYSIRDDEQAQELTLTADEVFAEGETHEDLPNNPTWYCEDI